MVDVFEIIHQFDDPKAYSDRIDKKNALRQDSGAQIKTQENSL